MTGGRRMYASSRGPQHGAQANELGPSHQPLELGCEFFVLEVQPADDAGDEIGLIGELEQECGLLFGLRRLHQDSAIDAGAPEERPQVLRQIVAGENAGSGHPMIVAALDAPKVVIGNQQSWRSHVRTTCLVNSSIVVSSLEASKTLRP